MLTGLSGSIESQHEQTHFSGAEQLAHHLGDLTAHSVERLVCAAREVIADHSYRVLSEYKLFGGAWSGRLGGGWVGSESSLEGHEGNGVRFRGSRNMIYQSIGK